MVREREGEGNGLGAKSSGNSQLHIMFSQTYITNLLWSEHITLQRLILMDWKSYCGALLQKAHYSSLSERISLSSSKDN